MDTPLIEHWNGTTWRSVPSPRLSFSGVLQALHVVGATNIWAVGESWTIASTDPLREDYLTLVEHWNGSSWSIVSSPNPSGYLNELWSVSGSSPSDVWAVGIDGNWSPPEPPTLIEHWNGLSWSVTPMPAGNTALTSVRALSATDAWAVGWSGNAGNQEVLLHWNGLRWQKMPVATPNNYIIHEMTRTKAALSWAVGEVASGAVADAQIFRWSTQLHGWSAVATSVPPGVNSVLLALDPVSSRDAWAVGDSAGTGGGTLIEHWNGSRWSIDPFPTIVNSELNGVAISPGPIKILTAVGFQNTATTTIPLILSRCA